jgi:hypothetical protein
MQTTLLFFFISFEPFFFYKLQTTLLSNQMNKSSSKTDTKADGQDAMRLVHPMPINQLTKNLNGVAIAKA